MSKFKLKSAFILGGFLLLSISVETLARTNVVISIAPPVREIVTPPLGYANCYDLPAGIYNGIWLNSRRVCEYNNVSDGRVWVGGYWGCLHYGFNGICSGWNWVGSHWMRPGYMEYGVHPHPYWYHRPYKPYFNPHDWDHWHDRDWHDRDHWHNNDHDHGYYHH